MLLTPVIAPWKSDAVLDSRGLGAGEFSPGLDLRRGWCAHRKKRSAPTGARPELVDFSPAVAHDDSGALPVRASAAGARYENGQEILRRYRKRDQRVAHCGDARRNEHGALRSAAFNEEPRSPGSSSSCASDPTGSEVVARLSSEAACASGSGSGTASTINWNRRTVQRAMYALERGSIRGSGRRRRPHDARELGRISQRWGRPCRSRIGTGLGNRAYQSPFARRLGIRSSPESCRFAAAAMPTRSRFPLGHDAGSGLRADYHTTTRVEPSSRRARNLASASARVHASPARGARRSPRPSILRRRSAARALRRPLIRANGPASFAACQSALPAAPIRRPAGM